MKKKKPFYLKTLLNSIITYSFFSSLEKLFITFSQKNSLFKKYFSEEIKFLNKGIPVKKILKITSKNNPELCEIVEYVSDMANMNILERKKALKIFNYLLEIHESYYKLKKFFENFYFKIFILNIITAIVYSIFPWLTSFIKASIVIIKDTNMFTYKAMPTLFDLLFYGILATFISIIFSIFFQDKDLMLKNIILVNAIYWLSQLVLFFIII